MVRMDSNHMYYTYMYTNKHDRYSIESTLTNFLQSISICSTLISHQRVVFQSVKLHFTSTIISQSVFNIITSLEDYQLHNHTCEKQNYTLQASKHIRKKNTQETNALSACFELFVIGHIDLKKTSWLTEFLHARLHCTNISISLYSMGSVSHTIITARAILQNLSIHRQISEF